MLRKPLRTRDAWYNLGRWAGEGFVWLSRKLKPERGSGNEDLDRVNNMYVEAVANEMTKEGIRELNEQTSSWARYDNFDPAHPQQGVYGGRYVYNPRHNQNLPSDSMSQGIGDAFMRGLRHEDVGGDFRFQDLQTGNIVQFNKFNNPFTHTAGKKTPSADPLYLAPMTVGYRPSATAGVRRPDAAAYVHDVQTTLDPFLARARAASLANPVQSFQASRPRAQTAIPQAAQYQLAAEPLVIIEAPRNPVPIVEFPGEAPVQRNPRKTTRPEISAPPVGGPIRRRPRSHAVAQPEPFDYVGYLSRLATLRYNF